jgi:hypothetical protein
VAALFARARPGRDLVQLAAVGAAQRGHAGPALAQAIDVAASAAALSFTSAKAAGLPSRACDTDLARRCDCISAWPVAPTCCAVRSALDTIQNTTTASASSAAASTMDSTRWCCAAVRVPRPGIGKASSASCASTSLAAGSGATLSRSTDPYSEPVVLGNSCTATVSPCSIPSRAAGFLNIADKLPISAMV